MWIAFDWKFTKAGTRRQRILQIGLGWGVADAVLSNFLILVLNASGNEFTWQYLQRSFSSNIQVFEYIALAGLVSILK